MIENYYNKNSKEFFENTVKVNMKELYIDFENYLKNGDSLLDLGCGSGRDSKYFISKGYDVLSVDSSEEIAKLAAEFIGKEVRIEDMRNINYIEKFKGIWACASILHIQRSEIETVFDKCYQALKENGIFYSSYKYGDKEETRNGRYFNCYNEESMLKLVTKTKFKVEKIWITSDVRENRDNEKWLNVILKKYI